MQFISLEKIHSSHDLVRKARESHLIDKAMTLGPNGLNPRDELYLYPSNFLSLLNNSCCDVLHLKNILSNSSIIASPTSVNLNSLKKTGVASRNIVFKKSNHHVATCISALQ